MPQDLTGRWNQRKLKGLIPSVFVPSVFVCRRWREGSILLSFLLFYGLIVGTYALIRAIEIQKFKMVVHIFSGFALFTEPMRVYRRVESLCKLMTANNVPFDLPTKECKSKYGPS